MMVYSKLPVMQTKERHGYKNEEKKEDTGGIISG